MTGNDNIIYMNDGLKHQVRESMDDQSTALISRCRKVSEFKLEQINRVLFEKIDNALFDLANRSDSDAQQSNYFDAMRILRKDRLHIDLVFTQAVLRAFDEFWAMHQSSRPNTQTNQKQADLALIDNEDLEESLAINNIVRVCENRYPKDLFVLAQRFHLLKTGQVESNRQYLFNPLDPTMICQCFSDALVSTDIELTAKLVVYKQFEIHAVPVLGALYDQINSELAKAQISIPITSKPSREEETETLHAPRTTSRDQNTDGKIQDLDHDEDPDEITTNTDIFALLQQLLNANHRYGGLDSHPVNKRPPSPRMPQTLIDQHALVDALSNLQFQSSETASSTPDGPLYLDPSSLNIKLIERISGKKSSQGYQALKDDDNNTIEIVTMLFEYILDEINLPDAMKALLSRLQIPMIKVALLDKSFFNNMSHPARQLLNGLAQAGLHWNDSGEREHDGLYSRIDNTVRRILAEFKDDPSIFISLNDEFNAWREQEQRTAEITEKRTNQTSRGKEQLSHAKQVVCDTLNERIDSYPSIPEEALEILSSGMKDVLLLHYLQRGPDSNEWHQAVTLCERLIWSVQPKQAYEQRQELLRSIPELLRNLHEQLNSISYDQHKMAYLFKALQQRHITCMRQRDDQHPATDQQNTKHARITFNNHDSGSATKDIEAQHHRQVINDNEFKQAEALELGTWLEISDNDVTSRVKLSWKSKVTDTYLFVNHKGMRALELSKQSIANHLATGSARVIEMTKRPVVESAIEAMFSTLNHSDSPTKNN